MGKTEQKILRDQIFDIRLALVLLERKNGDPLYAEEIEKKKQQLKVVKREYAKEKLLELQKEREGMKR